MDINIIAQSGAIVKVYAPKTTISQARKRAQAKQRRSDRRAEHDKPLKLRWTEHKRKAIEVGQRMVDAGLTKRGFRVKMCGNEIVFRECADCGHLVIERAQLCRDRLCPICNWRLALKRYSSMSQIMDVVQSRLAEKYPDKPPMQALMTLTVRNCAPVDIAQTLSKMQRAWNRMLAQRYIRPEVIGWARSIEVTYNHITGELHPHYHVIMIAVDMQSLAMITRDWLDQCRKEGLTVSHKSQKYTAIDGNRTEGDSMIRSILETYKYMVKSSDVMAMPLGVLRAFAEGVANKRLISYGGIIKQVARELQIADLDKADDTDPETRICTRCGSVALDQLIATWSMHGNHYLAMSGIDTSAIAIKAERWGVVSPDTQEETVHTVYNDTDRHKN